METEVKTRRKIQLRMPGRRTATGKNASLLLIKRNKVLYLFILPAFFVFPDLLLCADVRRADCFQGFCSIKRVFW